MMSAERCEASPKVKKKKTKVLKTNAEGTNVRPLLDNMGIDSKGNLVHPLAEYPDFESDTND